MQRNYVTKGEFSEFREEVRDRFAEQKQYTDEGFGQVFKQIDAVETNLGEKIDKVDNRIGGLETRFDSLEAKVDKLISLTKKS
jgi:predicted nuclease with TOPRIM domain